MNKPDISRKAEGLIDAYASAVRACNQEWITTIKTTETLMTQEMAKAMDKQQKTLSRLHRYIAQLESKAEKQEIKRTEMSEDELTEFYKLLYAWEDARDEYMKTLGGMTFDQDDVKAKASASVEAKAQLEEFVKGLCTRMEVTE